MTDEKPAPLKVICFLFDPNIGGPTIRARAVSTCLKKYSVDVSFALPNTNGTAKNFLTDHGFRVDNLQLEKPVLPNKIRAFVKFILHAPISVIRIVKYLKREKPDVIHVNGAFDILPALAGKLARVPIVWQLNDMLFSKSLSKILGWWVGSIADVVAVTSPPVTAHYGVEGYNPIILPVSIEISQYPSRKRHGQSPYNLALVGNWNPLKQIEDFIEVIDALRATGYDVKGHVFGKLLDSQKPYWEDLLAKVATKDLDNYIVVHGFTEDIPSALSDIDIVLVTSKSESGPLSCLEAMASSIPVVSYNVGDVNRMLDPESENPGGFVVENGDITALIKASAFLITNSSERLKIGANARRNAKMLYSTASIAPLTLQAYKKAMSTP